MENIENINTYEEPKQHKKGPSFWSENPNILFSPEYILEIFPTADMTYDQKLNAITRLVLYISIVVFMTTRKVRILIISIITICSIYIVREYDNPSTLKHTSLETFDSPAMAVLAKRGELPNVDEIVFDSPTPVNPFSNVNVTMYGTNIDKKPAPPAYNRGVSDVIVETVKQQIRELNQDNKEISDPTKDRLFKDLGENLAFEQSLRSYYSMPSTTVAGDQRAFAEFCYGSMISCKEGNKFACARNEAGRYIQ